MVRFQVPKPVQPQRSSGNLHQSKAAAAGTSEAFAAGLHWLHASHGLRAGRDPMCSPGSPSSPYAVTYQTLCQASAPDLGRHLATAAAGGGLGQWQGCITQAGEGPAGSGGSGLLGPSPPPGLVQRSANSAIVGGRVYNRWAPVLACSTIIVWQAVLPEPSVQHALAQSFGTCASHRWPTRHSAP